MKNVEQSYSSRDTSKTSSILCDTAFTTVLAVVYLLSAASLVASGTTTVRLSPGFNLVAYPYPHAIELNNTLLAASGAIGRSNSQFGDLICPYNNGYELYIFLGNHDAYEPELSGQWISPYTGEIATLVMQPGEAYLYYHTGSIGFDWVESNPCKLPPKSVTTMVMQGYNLISYPYSKTIDINELAFVVHGVPNRGVNVGDAIHFFDAETGYQKYVLVGDVGDPQFSWKWTNADTLQVEARNIWPGEGFWYSNPGTNSIEWVEENPFRNTSLWVWDEFILRKPEKVHTLIDFCQKYGINSIAFSINWNERFAARGANICDVEDLLFQLHSAGISVEVLFGAPDWIKTAPGYNYGKRLMTRVLDFQFDHRNDPLRRFDAIHVDVEPHGNNWTMATPRHEIVSQLQGFYDMLAAYQELIDSREWGTAPRPELVCDVVPWYVDPFPQGHPNNGESVFITTIDDSMERADRAIFSVPDRISLIGYRDTFSDPIGNNGLSEFNKVALDYLQSIGKSVTIGFEFLQNVPSHITFNDDSYEEFRAVRVLVEDVLMKRYSVLTGIGYHEYTDGDANRSLQDFINREVVNDPVKAADWKRMHFSKDECEVDEDNDGLLDEWEIRRFGHLDQE